MTNEQAQIIVNERVRPLSEKVRALKVELEQALTELSGESSTFFDVAGEGAGSDYVDLRADSVPFLLTANDVTVIRSKVIALLGVLQPEGAMDSFNRACVRRLRVEE